MKELTEKELVYYANVSLIEVCDCCGDYKPITNNHDGNDFVEFDGKQFLCKRCRE